MKPQDRQVSASRQHLNPVRVLITSWLLILCLGVFTSSSVFACHKGKAHGPNTCGGDGGEGPVVGFPTVASFIGPDYLDESSARACSPVQTGLTVANGRFNCSIAESVRITTAAMTLVAKKPAIGLCSSLTHYSPSTGNNVLDAKSLKPDFYQYGWNDDCSDGSCQIVVEISLSGADILAATGGNSDAVDLRISGTATGDVSNPFLGSQELAMSSINMQFRKPGSTSVAAVCDWFPTLSQMVFTSVGVPQN